MTRIPIRISHIFNSDEITSNCHIESGQSYLPACGVQGYSWVPASCPVVAYCSVLGKDRPELLFYCSDPGYSTTCSDSFVHHGQRGLEEGGSEIDSEVDVLDQEPVVGWWTTIFTGACN